MSVPRFSSCLFAIALVVTAAVQGPAGTASAAVSPSTPAGPSPDAAAPATAAHSIAYRHLALPQNQWATVYRDGLAEVHGSDPHRSKMVQVSLRPAEFAEDTKPTAAQVLPSQGELIMELARSGSMPYAQGQVLVVYGDAVTAPDRFAARATVAGAAPDFTNRTALNRRLAQLGVDRADRMFASLSRNRLAGMHTATESAVGNGVLDLSRAYRLHLTDASVAAAITSLRADPDVVYAGPNWTVSTSNTAPVAIPEVVAAKAKANDAARSSHPAGAAGAAGTASTADGIPDNYAVTSSAQSLLNRPGVNAIPAYLALANSGQLPGQGEIITNVSLGDLTDAGTAADPDDPCQFYASAYGPTTVVKGGQRYIDWPSMPLIPTYTSDAVGTLDPTGQACGQDPGLTEVGLDFSMMSPLPHRLQRPEAQGAGLTDLLGIAPGASYRLVIPEGGGAIADVDAAFLAAAGQTPRPSVITASLAFGLDQYGFASRYLEEDPMTQAVLATIVHGYHIVVSVSSGDGLRTYTNAPVAASGGSVDTDLARSAAQVTDLDDVAYSGAVSRVLDSGAIDVGGSTLNDIFAAPPGDPLNASLKAQQAFPSTRYTGGKLYSSGMGSRLNVSAPGDNVLSLSHVFGGDPTAVQVNLQGGTSASAPEVAAAAAVVLQVAKLTHHDGLIGNPLGVRQLLTETGTPLPAVQQSDLPIDVGPQIDIGRAIASMLPATGAGSVARVAIAQRQQSSALGGSFTTATDPAAISLAGRLVDAWITIAPDWIGVPDRGTTYTLTAATGRRLAVGRSPWARLQPAELLAAAGLPTASTTARSIPLTYTASRGRTVLARADFTLTLGPTDGTRPSVPAPIVDPVVRGATLRVSYDIRGLVGATGPTLVVSHPGRLESATGLFFRPAYAVPLTEPTGTVDVPVSALPGGGIYGVGIQDGPGGWSSRNDSAFAFVRLAPTGDAQPAVPLVSAGGAAFSHYAEPSFGAPLRVHYDVRPVRGADGAIVEFSAPGPTPWHNSNTFNNPNGSAVDANGYDTGSVASIRVTGTHRTITLDTRQIGLDPTMNHVVRVLATKNGEVVGEAGGVSSVSMDGVRPTDGGNVAGGFGINAHGSDGFVTSGQTTADGQTLSSVEVFDQATAAITATPLTTDHGYGTLSGGCPGTFAGDVGLVQDDDPVAGTSTFRVLDPIANGKVTGTWSPPSVFASVVCTAVNQESTDTAILTGQGGSQPGYAVATTDISKGTFSDPIDVTPELDPGASSIAGGIAQDTNSGQAVIPVVDATDPNAPGRIVLADLATGETSHFPSVSTYFAAGIAVDPTTHRALVPSTDTFGIYDLTTGTGSGHNPGGNGYQHPAADQQHGRFVVQEVASPDGLGSAPNNNAMSSITVLDEQGAVVKRMERFNFYDIYLLDMGNYVQLNPDTQTGYTLGPAGWQLASFDYGTGG